jgi:hypothetical protein
MAGYTGSFKDWLRTLTGLQKPGLVASPTLAATYLLPATNEIPLPLQAAAEQVSNSAKAVEINMSTAAAVVPAESGYKRFIDAIGNFFVKSAPEIEEVAEVAEPILALTPFGPEYDLVVNAIVGVQKTATASLSSGATLTGAQRMALVISAISPGVTAILASKGITESTAVQQAIAEFAQNVYNLQAGPTASATPAVAASTATATVA